MKTMNIHQDFDFNAFMQKRGFASLLAIAIWMLIVLSIVFQTLIF